MHVSAQRFAIRGHRNDNAIVRIDFAFIVTFRCRIVAARAAGCFQVSIFDNSYIFFWRRALNSKYERNCLLQKSYGERRMANGHVIVFGHCCTHPHSGSNGFHSGAARAEHTYTARLNLRYLDKKNATDWASGQAEIAWSGFG